MTDDGVFRLLFNQDNNHLNPCHKTIKFVKLRGTRVRKDGILTMFINCLKLEGIRCKAMDVLQALSHFIKVCFHQNLNNTLHQLEHSRSAKHEWMGQS